MSKLLSGIRYRRHDVSLGGALGSLLAAAGRDLPQPYILGASGHAFRLTLDVVISPSAPAQVNFHEQVPLWENLGAWFRRTTDRDEALERMRASIDRGYPVIAYDLMELPEYGLVVGYDGDRLACLTMADENDPVWMEASAWPPAAHAPWTRPEAIWLLDLAPGFDRRRAEVASLRFAVEHFWAPASRDSWLQHGKGAYEFWISVLTSPLPLHGAQPGLGHSYNLMVLAGARRDAANYVAELAERYPEARTLQGAAARYADVAGALAEAQAVLPFPGTAGLETPEQRQALAGCLRRALTFEHQAVDEIERALRALR
ncbi:MAG TPA: hypothetical protein VNT75_18140 [Symbiobacteriaceae bacterium]|nr:hypothetical protein [Symbiobacteriaceae bacterium]